MSDEITLRKMTAADIPGGMRLCGLAGWNQVERDWERFLEFDPQGCFVACLGNQVRATVTTIKYQKRFAWIGMLLTDPEVRRRGIGTLLLEHAAEYLQASGVETIKLDGTPMGRSLYLQRGFLDEYSIERWQSGSRTPTGAGLPPMTRSDLEQVSDWERHVFGADRSRLLVSLWEEEPRYSAVVRAGDEILGYILGRRGSRAHYLGPWVALNCAAAGQLLNAFLDRFADEAVFLDLCTLNPEALRLAASRGFRFQRPLTRMLRGPNSHPGEPRFVYAIAGPELG